MAQPWLQPNGPYWSDEEGDGIHDREIQDSRCQNAHGICIWIGRAPIPFRSRRIAGVAS
jgi:hypothetical protein